MPPVQRQLCKFWLPKAPVVKASQLGAGRGGGGGGHGGGGGDGTEQRGHSWAGVQSAD